MKNIYNKPTIPLLALIYLISVAALEVSPDIGFFIVSAAVASLQVFIGMYPWANAKLTRLVLRPMKGEAGRPFSKKVPWILILIPVLSLLLPSVAYVALTFVCVFYSRYLYCIINKRIKYHESVADAAEALKTLSPEVVVYMAGPKSAAYQVNQWIEVLEALPCKVVILTRNLKMLDSISSTSLPVVYAKRAKEVELVFDAGVQTVLYPGNSMFNAQALRHYELNHFFINHGESDKAVNQSQLLLAYDKLFLAGELALERLSNTGFRVRGDQVELVGRPQAELRLNRISSPLESGLKKVLYAPTWEGFVEHANYSSVSDFGLSTLTTLVESFDGNVVFKPHPFTGSVSEEAKKYYSMMLTYCKKNHVQVVSSDMSIYECMNDSDVLVTDVSSVLNEYLLTNKPVILTRPPGSKDTDMSSVFPSSVCAYLLESGSDICNLINEIRIEDPKEASRIDLYQRSLGDNAYKRFEAAVLRSLDTEKNET